MKKLFITSPVSIVECFITKGLAQGFRDLGFFVVEKDVRETTLSDIKKLNPDYILGYDYGYLVNEELAKNLDNEKNYTFIHYFADEPKSKFAYTDRPELYNVLKSKKNTIIFNKDSEFLSEFDNSIYLPLGVNPKPYKSNFSGYKHNISFAGRPLTNKRQEFLTNLIKKYGKISLFCYRDHFEKSLDEIINKNILDKIELENYKNSYKGFVKTEEELADIYNSSKINININITNQGKNSINYRVFEVLASSGFLLTDEMPDLYTNFEIGKELEVYKDFQELTDKIDFYMNNLNIAQNIARKGRKAVINNHTFKMRVEKILKYL